MLLFAPRKGEAGGQFRIGETAGEEVRDRTPANISKEPDGARQPLGFDTDTIAERKECFRGRHDIIGHEYAHRGTKRRRRYHRPDIQGKLAGV